MGIYIPYSLLYPDFCFEFLDESSLKFVLPFLSAESTSLWTAHVNAHTEGNSIARFWRAIETIFWRRYMVKPSTTSFGIEDFDYFPKGTTALITPVKLYITATDLGISRVLAYIR